MFKQLKKYWNKTSGVIIMITPEYDLTFIEIKGLFLFKLIKIYMNLEKTKIKPLENIKFIYENDMSLIVRLIEFKYSEDETFKQILKTYAKSKYENI